MKSPPAVSHNQFESESELQPGEHAPFRRPITAVGRTAIEQNLLVLGRDFHHAVQVPVDPAHQIVCLSRGAGRVGEHLEYVVIDLEPAVATDQLERAPAIATRRALETASGVTPRYDAFSPVST